MLKEKFDQIDAELIAINKLTNSIAGKVADLKSVADELIAIAPWVRLQDNTKEFK